jgi:hypothetical protein
MSRAPRLAAADPFLSDGESFKLAHFLRRRHLSGAAAIGRQAVEPLSEPKSFRFRRQTGRRQRGVVLNPTRMLSALMISASPAAVGAAHDAAAIRPARINQRLRMSLAGPQSRW